MHFGVGGVAEAVIDGCQHVGGSDAAFDWESRVFVGLAVDDSTTNATAGQCDREAVAPVIASRVAVDLRCVAELTQPHDQRFVEQTTLGQVLQQRRVALIHDRHQERLQRLRVSRVRVPAPLIRLVFDPGPIDADD